MVAIRMPLSIAPAPKLAALAAGGVGVAGMTTAAPDAADEPVTAQGLALRYVQAVSAYWRNEPAALRALERRLALCWDDGPAEPAGAPAACSPHAAGGHGIRWYDTAGGVLGFVPGRPGCYRAPASWRLTAIGGRMPS